ncbi:MAG: carbohydrate-binding domain-containing protein, partial [Bacilli bacterium]|nr:carbohydrate-binding domain-containing protein [Bacilli bacterium]
DFKYKASGSTYVRVATDEIRTLNSSYYALANSVKGIKAGAIEYDSDEDDIDDVTVTEGEYDIYIAHLAKVTINSTDDCIHTNYGTVTLDSSNLTLDTFDDGAHADYALTVNNASIIINSSYEGLEGANVTINGENTNIVSTSNDDGINAASDLVTSSSITINDGYVRVLASGDGIDANGELHLKGGTVIVEGPGSGNGSLDADKIYFEGGIVFACSTSGMTESMSATQNTFAYQGSTMSSGSLIAIVDSNDSVLFSYTLKQSCNQLIFSHESLTIGSSYKLKSGSSTISTISMSSSLTKVGISGGGGGGGNPPGGWH